MNGDLPKGDFNVPPGVRTTDIPGNNPYGDKCPVCGEPLSEDDLEAKECPHCGAELI